MARMTIVDEQAEMADALSQAFSGTDVIIKRDWTEIGRATLVVPASTTGTLIFELPPRAYDSDLLARVSTYFEQHRPLAIGDYRSFVTGNLLGFPLLVVVALTEHLNTSLLGTSNVQIAFGAALRAGNELQAEALAIQAMRPQSPARDFDFYAQQMRLAFGLVGGGR